MLIAGAAVDFPLHIRLFLNIQFPDTVENDMDVDIAAFIVTVSMRTDNYLMPGEMPAGKLQSECMGLLGGQLSVFTVLRIKADDIVV